MKAEEVAMAETYTGEVRNGVVVFDGPTPPLPEGSKVRVVPLDLGAALADLSRTLLDVAGKASGLPPDLAENHDHDLHGTPEHRVPTGSVEDASDSKTLADRLKAVIGKAQGLPPDLAEQHDHYLHGRPKR
jgi:hypothetical protein